MVRQNKKWAVLLAVVLVLALVFMGYNSDILPRARDITQVKLMRTMAVDQGEEGRVKITISGNTQKEGSDGQSRPPLVLSQEALTIFGGCLTLQKDSDGYVEFGHLTECIIGEELAKTGIEGITDYIERDFSLRLGTKLFLVTGATGEEAIQGTASKNTAMTDRLTSISEDRSMGGLKWPYTLREYLSQEEDNGVALMPVLTLEDNPDYDPEGEGDTPEKEIHLSGLAYFVDQKLGGLLTEEESRGTSLLTDGDQLDRFEVTLKNGTVAGIQLVFAQCVLEPEFDGEGVLTGVTAHVHVKGDLNELKGWADPLDEKTLEEIRTGFFDQLRQTCLGALNRSQGDGADFLHLRRQLICQCPLEATAIRDDWAEWFPKLELDVVIEGQIERSYEINQPLPEGGTAEWMKTESR